MKQTPIASIAGNYIVSAYKYSIAATNLAKDEITILPAIFCLRHSIELLQKAFLISAGEDIRKIHGHKLDNNYKLLESRWFEIDYPGSIKKLLLEAFGENKNDHEIFNKTVLSTLKEKSERYLKHQYLGKIFDDNNNVNLRYPDSSEFNKAFDNFLIDKEKIVDLQNDIKDIFNLIFFSMYESIIQKLE